MKSINVSVGSLLAQSSRVQLRKSKASIRPVIRRAAPASDARPSSSYAQFEGGVGTVSNRSTASASTKAESSKAVLEDTKLFLQSELQGLFATGRLSRQRYSESMSFEDALVKLRGLDAYERNVQTIRRLFSVKLVTHAISVTGSTEITTRWTMELMPRLPLQRKLVFTGKSIYGVDASTGLIQSQKDVWDAVQDNSHFSVEGLAFVLKQASSLQVTPGLESPRYEVLRKTKEYEVRQYEPYLAAETDMPSSSGAAAGDGFNDLAAYIFGGNSRRENMEMTTPVFSTAGQGAAAKMEFPMEERFGLTLESLPAPNSTKVTTKLQEGGIVAAATFSGLPLDFEVTEAERRLRALLVYEGFKPQEGYRLARYNDPFTPPFLRRNEVLIRLDGFEWD